MWKNVVNEKHIYVIQIDSGSAKDTKLAEESLKDWKQTGFGHNKNGTEVLIFSKNFENSISWVEWAKKVPFQIKEVDKKGKSKKVKTSVIDSSEGKNRCKACNKLGHNRRTCKLGNGIQTQASSVSDKPKRQNSCKNCGQLGHNRATCKLIKDKK